MYDELIKAFREWPRVSQQYEDSLDQLHDQAADAIEELVKALERSKEWETFWEKEANEALKKFQTTVASMPRWIPVTERLPKVRTWVLCYCRANSFDVFRMTDEGHWQYGNRSIYMKGYVTHWMPLPPAPKEE